MALNPIPILRIVQGVLAVLVLGLTGYVVNAYNRGIGSPDEANFMIWNCVWTFLALLYLGLAPTYFPNIHHKYAVLAVEAITVIFWFAGFIALAVFINDFTGCRVSRADPLCGTAKAAVAFGAFEWLAWTATLALVIKALWHYRKSGNGGPQVGIDGAAGSNSYPMDDHESGDLHQAQQYKPGYDGLPIGQPINIAEANPENHHTHYGQPGSPLQMPPPAAFGGNDQTRVM